MTDPSFSQSYSSEKRKVSPGDLYLDPNNVRTITSLGDIKDYSEAEIISDKLQAQLWQYMYDHPKCKINALAGSIESNGWINFAGRFLVEELKSYPGKYLVLEGNRRTTALKYILKNKSRYRKKLIKQIGKIEVDVLQVNPGANRDFVVQVLKGFTNTSGIVLFDAMNQAFNTYIAYMQKYSPKGNRTFRYVNDIALEIKGHLGLGTKTVKKHLGIVQVYEQIRGAGYTIDPGRFTLLEEAIRSAKLKRDYFGYDDAEGSTLMLSQEGVCRWADLCLNGEPPPIHKPGQMNRFSHVFVYSMESGDESIQKAVELGTRTLDQGVIAMKNAKAPDRLADTLENVLGALGKVGPEDYRHSKHEDDLINQLEKKLRVLKGMQSSVPKKKPAPQTPQQPPKPKAPPPSKPTPPKEPAKQPTKQEIWETLDMTRKEFDSMDSRSRMKAWIIYRNNRNKK